MCNTYIKSSAFIWVLPHKKQYVPLLGVLIDCNMSCNQIVLPHVDKGDEAVWSDTI